MSKLPTRQAAVAFLRGLSWLIGVGIFLMMAWMWWQRPPKGLPPGTLSPIAAFEFAKDKREATHVFAVVVRKFQGQPKAREMTATKLSRTLYFDQFVIVPLYVLLLILIGLLCIGIEAKAFWGFVGLCLAALFAGIFDTLENTYTIVALERLVVGQLTDGIVSSMRMFSILKWVFLGVALAWIGAWMRGEGRRRQASLLFVFAGLGVGIGGVFSPIVMRVGLCVMGLSMCFVGWQVSALVASSALGMDEANA